MIINLHQIVSFIKHFVTAKRNGHGVHSPFAYQLCEEVFYNTSIFYDFGALLQIRKTLLKNKTHLQIQDFGAGSKTFKSSNRSINKLVEKGISTPLQAQLFYKLINFLNCKIIIELGTSIGLTALYLANANKKAIVHTFEGSIELVNFAKQLALQNNTTNINFINAKFDEALPEFLKNNNGVDFFYVDGNHTYQATLNYFFLRNPYGLKIK